MPGEMHRRDDRDRGQGLLGQPGLRPGRHRRRPASTPSPASPRGASTITQQLVRARLLPAEAFEGSDLRAQDPRDHPVDPPHRRPIPGEAGKQQIITAYLNQNFYGNQSYGVKAAAKGYFGKSLEDLTLAQIAILAAIPQSPTKFDLVRNAEEVCLDRTSTTARTARRSSSSCPTTRRDRPAPQPRPRADEDAAAR